MLSFSPTTLSLIAIGLSTVSIIMSAFSLRRQGIPDKFEGQRRAMESLTQTNPDRWINGFKTVYITVSEDCGPVDTIKKIRQGPHSRTDRSSRQSRQWQVQRRLRG